MNIFNISISAGAITAITMAVNPYWEQITDSVLEHPFVIGLFAPLFFAVVLHILARIGFLQKTVFGGMYQDLITPNHNGERLRLRDKSRLRIMLRNWKQPKPYLQRADEVFALWAGREKWSLEGFDRCWRISLLYPFFVLLLVWIFTSRGQVGVIDVFPRIDETLRRVSFLIFLLLSALMFYVYLIFVKKSAIFNFLINFFDVRNIFISPEKTLTEVFSMLFIVGWLSLFYIPITVFTVISGVFFGVVIGSSFSSYSVVVAIFGAYTDIGVYFIVFSFMFLEFSLVRSIKFYISRQWVGVVLIFFIHVFLYGSASYFFPMFKKKDLLGVINTPVALLFFIGILPLLNGLADWISLNATRKFIADMQMGNKSIAWLYAWDMGIALVLTLAIYGGSLGILHTMQYAGWGVNVREILVDLRDHPWSGQSNWFLALAVTNFIPTFVHIALRISEKTQPHDKQIRIDISTFLKKKGTTAPCATASDIIYILKIQPWLDRITVVGLTLAVIPVFGLGVPWCAGLMLD